MELKLRRKKENLKPGLYAGAVKEVSVDNGEAKVVVGTSVGDATLIVPCEEEEGSKLHHTIESVLNKKIPMDQGETSLELTDLKGCRVAIAAEPKRGSGGRVELRATSIFNIDQLKKAVAEYETAETATANEQQATTISA